MDLAESPWHLHADADKAKSFLQIDFGEHRASAVSVAIGPEAMDGAGGGEDDYAPIDKPFVRTHRKDGVLRGTT